MATIVSNTGDDPASWRADVPPLATLDRSQFANVVTVDATIGNHISGISMDTYDADLYSSTFFTGDLAKHSVDFSMLNWDGSLRWRDRYIKEGPGVVESGQKRLKTETNVTYQANCGLKMVMHTKHEAYYALFDASSTINYRYNPAIPKHSDGSDTHPGGPCTPCTGGDPGGPGGGESIRTGNDFRVPRYTCSNGGGGGGSEAYEITIIEVTVCHGDHYFDENGNYMFSIIESCETYTYHAAM